MRFPGDAGELSLWPDHVNHSASDFDRACERMEMLGFTLAPRSDQLAPDPSGELKPTGMANRCVMLEEGYIEISGNVADTDSPAVRSFRKQCDRYTGVHLLALGSPSPEAQVGRLSAAGFRPASTMKYQRMVGTPDGDRLARFTLATTPGELLPEARLLMVRHESPDLIWQRHWLDHANGAIGLAEVVIAASDMTASVDRLARFLGTAPVAMGPAVFFELARGRLTVLSVAEATSCMAVVASPPCIVGYVVRVADIGKLRGLLRDAGIQPLRTGAGWVSVEGGSHLGSTIFFAEPDSILPWHS